MHLDAGRAQTACRRAVRLRPPHRLPQHAPSGGCLPARHAVDGKSGRRRGIRYLAPVRAGDSLTMRLEVTGLRPSAGRPDLGFLKFTSEMLDGASGKPAMRMTGTLMFARRDTRAKPRRRRHELLRGSCGGRPLRGREPHLHRRGDQGVRASIRPAAVPCRRGGGRRLSFRRPDSRPAGILPQSACG